MSGDETVTLRCEECEGVACELTVDATWAEETCKRGLCPRTVTFEAVWMVDDAALYTEWFS